MSEIISSFLQFHAFVHLNTGMQFDCCLFILKLYTVVLLVIHKYGHVVLLYLCYSSTQVCRSTVFMLQFYCIYAIVLHRHVVLLYLCCSSTQTCSSTVFILQFYLFMLQFYTGMQFYCIYGVVLLYLCYSSIQLCSSTVLYTPQDMYFVYLFECRLTFSARFSHH